MSGDPFTIRIFVADGDPEGIRFLQVWPDCAAPRGCTARGGYSAIGLLSPKVTAWG
jgi:hypothetical protein